MSTPSPAVERSTSIAAAVLGPRPSDLIVRWGDLAAFAARNLARGRLLHVGDRLDDRSWAARASARHRAVDVVAAEVVPLDRRPDAAPAEESVDTGDDATDDAT